MIIAIDFDGTIVKHKYPKLGDPVPGAIEWMRRFTALGAKIILYTMRSGKELNEAVNFLNDNYIDLWGINKNPTQTAWTTSPKAYANVYIDDAAFGCPLMVEEGENRPYVDWDYVGPKIERVLMSYD